MLKSLIKLFYMKQTQGFGTVAIIGVLAVVVLVGGVLFVNNKNTEKAAMESKMMDEKMKMEEAAMMEKKMMDEKAMMEKGESVGQSGDSMETEADAMMKKDEAMEGDSMMKKEDSAMMDKEGIYAAYSSESLAMAQKGKTVLFFHASWCPTCRTADADITKNAATIPAGATILKVDYDKEVALKQKYGVTSQHTFVEIDASGTLVEKWSGGNLSGIVSRL
jgi:thiol-disulfide isomerase/thioredoxin